MELTLNPGSSKGWVSPDLRRFPIFKHQKSRLDLANLGIPGENSRIFKAEENFWGLRFTPGVSLVPPALLVVPAENSQFFFPAWHWKFTFFPQIGTRNSHCFSSSIPHQARLLGILDPPTVFNN